MNISTSHAFCTAKVRFGNTASPTEELVSSLQAGQILVLNADQLPDTLKGTVQIRPEKAPILKALADISERRGKTIILDRQVFSDSSSYANIFSITPPNPGLGNPKYELASVYAGGSEPIQYKLSDQPPTTLQHSLPPIGLAHGDTIIIGGTTIHFPKR